MLGGEASAYLDVVAAGDELGSHEAEHARGRQVGHGEGQVLKPHRRAAGLRRRQRQVLHLVGAGLDGQRVVLQDASLALRQLTQLRHELAAHRVHLGEVLPTQDAAEPRPRVLALATGLGWVQLQLLLALLGDERARHHVGGLVLAGVVRPQHSPRRRVALAHELEERRGQGQVHQPVVLQNLGQEHAQEPEVRDGALALGRVLRQRRGEEPGCAAHVEARGLGALAEVHGLVHLGLVVVAEPHAQVLALQLGRHQRVELEGGAQARALLALELHLQDALAVRVQPHHLQRPAQQLLAARHLDALVLEAAHAELVGVVAARGQPRRPLPLQSHVALRLQPHDGPAERNANGVRHTASDLPSHRTKRNVPGSPERGAVEVELPRFEREQERARMVQILTPRG